MLNHPVQGALGNLLPVARTVRRRILPSVCARVAAAYGGRGGSGELAEQRRGAEGEGVHASLDVVAVAAEDVD